MNNSSQSLTARQRARTQIVPLLLLVIVPSLAYSNSFEGTFVFDDEQAIVENPTIRSMKQALFAPLENTPGGLHRREFVQFTLAINYAIGGLDPIGYHAFNLIVHVCAALLLFGILKRVLARRSDWLADNSILVACSAALIWAIHPVQTESVTYVIQRLESVTSLFYLAVFYCTIRADESKRSWLWQVLAGIAMLLGVFSKEIIVTAPFLLLIFDRIFLASSVRTLLAKRKWLYGWLGICIVILMLNVMLRKPELAPFRNIDMSPQAKATSWEYLSSQPGVILHYLTLLAFPIQQCSDYLWPIAKSPLEIYGKGAIVLAMLLSSIILLFRRSGWGFLAFGFFLILAPTSTIYPLLLAFEHRVYLASCLPITGLVIALFWLARKCFPNKSRLSNRKSESSNRIRLKQVAPALCVLMIVCFFASLTYSRNRVYFTRKAFWTDVTLHAPQNPRGWNNVGVALIDDEGQAQSALEYFEKAIELSPNYARAWKNKGNIHLLRGEYQLASDSIKRALDRVPNNPVLLSEYANVQYRLGNVETAIEYHQAALKLIPDYLQSLGELAFIHQQLKQHELAEVYLRRLIDAYPENEAAWIGLSETLQSQGRTDEAIASLNQALEVSPNNPSIYYLRGQLVEAESVSRAERNYKLALSIDKKFSLAYFELGRIRYQKSEFSEATILLREAVSGSLPSDTRITSLRMMADSYEKLGNNDEAARCRKAIGYLTNGQMSVSEK